MNREPAEVSVTDHELIAAATQVIDQHGDGELHTVAAAVRDERGDIHVAVNLFHFTGGPCAELVALGAARAAGAREPQTIVAVGDAGRGVLSPCGRDRQVFADHHPDLRVIVPTADGPVVVRAVDRLPHAYQVPGCRPATEGVTPNLDAHDGVRSLRAHGSQDGHRSWSSPVQPATVRRGIDQLDGMSHDRARTVGRSRWVLPT